MAITMKRIISLLAAAAVLSTASYAKIDENTIKSEEFIYSGKSEANAKMSITVLKNSVTLDEFNSSENKEALLVGYREALTDSEGDFEVSFNFGGVSDIYEAYIGAEGAAEIKHEKIHYIYDVANQAALTALSDAMAETAATRSESVKTVIKNNYKDLGMDISLVEKADDTDILNASDILLKSKSQGDVTEAKESAEYLDKALAVSLFNSGEINVFGEYEDLLINEKSMKDWTDKAFMDDEVKAFIEEKLATNSLSFEAFDKTLTEAVALGVIYGADGFGTITSYLKQYADVLDIDSSDVTDSYAQGIIGNKYNELSDTNIGKDGSGSSSGNGSGSGGSGGGGGGGGGGGSFGSKNAASGLTVGGYEEENEPPLEKDNDGNNVFSDLSGFEWAEEAISELKKAGIIAGRAEGVYAPQEAVLREEFVKMILGAGKFEDLYGDISFSDVNENDWFYPYIKNAYLCGIINGISETEFGSGNEISRQDMAVVCYNMLSRKGMLENTADLAPLSYGDTESISDYAVLAVRYLSDAGILNGDENNMFLPTKSLNRAEAAAVIYRTYLLIENK